MRYWFFAAAVAGSLAASSAAADTISQTEVFDDVTDFTLDFSGFDSALGNLTSVTLEIDLDLTLAAGSLTGSPDTCVDGICDLGLFYGAFLTGDLGILASPQGPLVSCIGNSCTGNYPSQSETVAQLISLDPLNFIDEDNAFTLSVSRSIQRDIGGTFQSATTEWLMSGEASLVFTYDPVSDTAVVPLPAAMPMLLAGLVALGGLSFRRRSRS